MIISSVCTFETLICLNYVWLVLWSSIKMPLLPLMLLLCVGWSLTGESVLCAQFISVDSSRLTGNGLTKKSWLLIDEARSSKLTWSLKLWSNVENVSHLYFSSCKQKIAFLCMSYWVFMWDLSHLQINTQLNSLEEHMQCFPEMHIFLFYLSSVFC